MTRIGIATCCALALLLSCCTGGGVGLGSGFGRTPVVDYFLALGEPHSFSGAAAGDADLQALARQVSGNRALYMGLYAQGGRFDTAITRLMTGRVDSAVLRTATEIDDPAFLPLLTQGEVEVNGTSTVELPIPTTAAALAGYTNLRLTGTFPTAPAQAMINEVVMTGFTDSGSDDRIDSSWTLRGSRDGTAFELGFTQPLRAFADAYYANL